MNRLFRLCRPFLQRAVAPWLVMAWLVSIFNWINREGYDRVLEIALVGAGLALAHAVHRDCSRGVFEYLIALPINRCRALRLPFVAGGSVVATLAVFVLLHETTGMAWVETRVTRAVAGLDAGAGYRCRDFHPWLNLLGLPLAAFWVYCAAIRSWTQRHAAVGGRYAHGAAIFLPVVGISLSGLVITLGTYATDPWRLSVPGAALLVIAWFSARHVANHTDTLATEHFADKEQSWTS